MKKSEILSGSSNMKALVTGGAGFIGSAIARALILDGTQVRVLDNMSTGLMENLPETAELIAGDIRDLGTVAEACSGIDVVFHQAAFKSVPKSIADPMLAETTNSQGTLNVLLGAEQEGVSRVVYASSSSVYGDIPGLKREEMPAKPITPYGVSKLAGEHYCGVWSGLGRMSTVCLRYFNVFGPGQPADSAYAAVFPAFISSLMNHQAPTIFGDGEQTRDFAFIDDVVTANLLAARADEKAEGQVMNICGGSPKTVNDVYKSIAGALGKSIEPCITSPRIGDIRHSSGAIEKAGDLLNWTPKADWDRAVDTTVEWFVRKAK